MDNTLLNWVFDNWELLSAILVFIVYFKIDKRHRNAEVKQSEGNALSTMQEATSILGHQEICPKIYA